MLLPVKNRIVQNNDSVPELFSNNDKIRWVRFDGFPYRMNNDMSGRYFNVCSVATNCSKIASVQLLSFGASIVVTHLNSFFVF